MGSPMGGVFRTGHVLDLTAGLYLLLMSTLVLVHTHWLFKGDILGFKHGRVCRRTHENKESELSQSDS